VTNRSGNRKLVGAAIVAGVCCSPPPAGGSSRGGVASLGTTNAASSRTTGASTVAGTPAAREQDLLAFSACMRSHGVAAFPDPTRNADGSYDFGAERALVYS
jgi:hypothetical protein